MKKFPKIGQFRNAIKAVSSHCSYNELPLPTLIYRGFVKLHGTNAGVVIHPDNSVDIQSRERIISVDNDNAGFAFYVENVVGKQVFVDAAERVRILWELEEEQSVAFYGEFCGGKIQKGVALSELDKMLVLFNVAVFTRGEEAEKEAEYGHITDHFFEDVSPVKHIEDFPRYMVTIDFNNPAAAQNKLVEITEAVEAECPVGKAHGVSGIGEGVVWRAICTDYDSSQFWFKVKGDKHSASKVKVLAEVDPTIVTARSEFVDYAVTEGRLQQGIDKLREQGLELDRSSTGNFLSWITKDILEEEGDVMAASALEPSDVKSGISRKARTWFFNNIDTIE